LPHVELRATTQGRERLVLTNEHQMAPVVFRFEPGEPRAGFSFEQVRRGDTVYEAREATIFMLAAGHPAGVIRLIDPGSGELVLSVASARGEATNYDLTATRRWRDLLDKLFFIQQHVARHGSLSLEDFAKDPAGEAYMTESLFSILRDRRREVTETISFEMTPTEPALPQSKANVFIDSKCSASLLSLDIPLGSVKKTVLDADRFLAACRAARDEAVATGEPVRVRLEGMKIIEEYIDLIHEDAPWSIMYEAFDRLSRSSAVHEGYFSRADARAAGVSDAVFDALVGEHKAEQVALDVFHLTHFPRSDHEELVTLWLQTDRRGVISHDTALLIHELSDILPRRRHITVPPGWDPGARKLGNKVVLHHAEIGEHEIRWLGPVPYTAPLRTVRDCIEAHLSPDLVEQAIAEGITRGMFTEDELPPAVRRGAA
jgi:hypothetical protein